MGLFFFIVLSLMYISIIDIPTNPVENQLNTEQWGGYYPNQIYTVFDKDTGVYYAITDKGGITPMYTIDGEVKLVDQGNEHVVHKNLGESIAQE